MSSATCARRWWALRRQRSAAGDEFHEPEIAVRTGDTPAAERARFARRPADILITTPESLYLLLTSNARKVLTSIETVILDEIHALVPTKRGSHLALSLERLEAFADARCSASDCRRRSVRWKKWRTFWAARKRAEPEPEPLPSSEAA